MFLCSGFYLFDSWILRPECLYSPQTHKGKILKIQHKIVVPYIIFLNKCYFNCFLIYIDALFTYHCFMLM